MLLMTGITTSIDAPLGEDNDQTLLEMLPDESSINPEILFEDEKSKQYLIRCLSNLSPKYKEVIVERFGLLGHQPKTLEEVAEQIGLTRKRVRQIQAEAVKRLRKLTQ